MFLHEYEWVFFAFDRTQLRSVSRIIKKIWFLTLKNYFQKKTIRSSSF